MERRQLGRTDMHVSVLGFGGSPFAYGGTSQEDSDRLLNGALDLGLNAIDTAECYPGSEEKIGRAIGHRRAEYYLFTKCGHASGFEEPDWDPAMLAKQIDRSLQRLQTDHLDIVQLHSCELPLLQQGDVIDVLRRAKEAGKTRYIGHSGDREEALFAVECGAFDTLQTSVNIADQQCIDLFLGKAAEHGVGVIAKRPLANAAWERCASPGTYGHNYWQRLQKLRYPFLEGPDGAGVALRFTLAQPGVCTAIVGTTRPERYAGNMRMLSSDPLSDAEIGEIRDRWRECAEPDWVGSG